jgi:hypothetical protein
MFEDGTQPALSLRRIDRYRVLPILGARQSLASTL